MSFLDISVFVLSVVGIFLEMYQKPLFWLTYILAAIILAFQFYTSRLYGSTLLQLIYIVLSIYGWIKWSHQDEVKIIHTTIKQAITYSITCIILTIIFYYLFVYTQDSNPLLDSALTAICLIATYMAIYKQIESWFVFAVSVFISVPLYYGYHMYFTAISYVLFGVLDLSGGIKWLKLYNSKATQTVNL